MVEAETADYDVVKLARVLAGKWILEYSRNILSSGILPGNAFVNVTTTWRSVASMGLTG